jgi:formate-dependent nitrite reductase membrane component NrfD
MGQRASDHVARLLRMLVLVLGLQVAALAVFLIAVQGSGAPASLQALSGLLSGRFSALFWLGAVLAGTVAPLVLGLVARRSIGVAALASVLALVGGFLVKYVIIQAGQA